MHNNLDDELHPLYAAGNPYAGKNSKIERSLRARRQLRDRRGRFIYMGGGLSTIFRKRDGSLVNTIGRSVGASNREGFAQLMVENSAEGIDAGVYDVPAGNSQVAQAILPGSASSVPYTGSATSADIVDFDSIERRDAPLGWTKNDDGSFSSEDGEWSIARDDKGRWTAAQNDKAIDGDFRDAASAITRATAIDAEDTADEETKKRVATLRERGSDPIAIDRAIFNAPEYEVGEDADQYFYDEASTGTKVQTSFKYGDYEDNVNLIGTRQEDGSWKFERNPNEPWNEDFNKFEDTYTPKEVLDQFESTQIAELPEEQKTAIAELTPEEKRNLQKEKDLRFDGSGRDAVAMPDSLRELLKKLDDSKAKYEDLETQLDSTEDAQKQGEIVDQLVETNEQIGDLEVQAGQIAPDTVASIERRMNRLERDIQRRMDRGEDTSAQEQEINDLEQKRQALIDVGEKNGGAEADGGAEGTLPDDLVGEDARSARVERRGDSLRDVSGNVVATKVDEVANAEEIREGGAKVVDLFEVNPENAEVFRNALIEAAESNPYGKSVTIHDLDYYKQDGVRLFLTQDGKGGIALNGDEIVSGFMGDGAADRGQGAVQSMIAKMVELGGRRLDAYDTILPKLYAEAGFKPVARIKWDDEFAPEGWDYELYGDYNEGRPDIVFMAYDPARVGSKYDPSEGDYVDDYDKGLPAQKAALQPVTDEVVTKDLTDRQKAAQARRQAAQEANDALKGGDGLLEGEVPSNARGSISNQALQLAPIGQVLEATSRNGRKRRFIKVGKDTWKRTDKPDDKKRYRSFELRGGKADFVARTEADVPSVDETRGPVDRYRPKPFSFPRNASEEELARLREIYQNQADTDENPGGVLRATETVRLIDMAIARRKGEPIARLRPATQRRTEDIRAGRATAPENVAPRRTRRRTTAPLLPENVEDSGESTQPYTPAGNMPEGTTDEPQTLAEMFDSVDLKKAYIRAIISGDNSVSMNFPGVDGEEGPRANVPLDAIRDALQLQGIDTNELLQNIKDQLAEREQGGAPVSERGPEDDVTRSQFMDGLYQTRQEIIAAISLARMNDRPEEEIKFLEEQRDGLTRAIRRRELRGERSTREAQEVNLDDFKWDADSPDIYTPDLIMEAMRRNYPEGKVLPNGDLLVATNFRTDRNGNRLKYEVIVTKTEDETFYTYIRETNLSMMGAPGSVRSMRFGEMRQSAHALNNQTVKAISKVMMTDRRVKIEVWFNNKTDRERDGQFIQIDELDENGVPTHAKQRVFTYEAIRKIQEAVNDDDITEEMINTLYNYVLNMGNGEEVAATLYESFGLDIDTMNRFIDAVNQNIDNRLDAVQSFSKWQTANGTPIAEGDLVEYVGGPDQPGYEDLNGRRGIVEIRRLEHTVTDRNTGVKYTYTDMVYVRMVDENGVPTRENYRIIPAKHLSIIKTAAGTDGSERRGDAGMTVPPPALTRRATNRYAGRRRLRDVAPYVSQYDRNNLDSPTVTIDGESYPVRLSRASLIPENVEKISATPADLQVGDFIKTFEDIDGYPTSRLNEVVKIEELEDGSRLVHTVMPLDLFSGRTAATQFGPDDTVALEVYREADVPDVEIDVNAPGLSSNQVARLAELAHQVDMSQVDAETQERVREIVTSTDPASLPYTPRQYADIFRELLEAEDTGLIGPVSPEEANRIAERILRDGQPTPDAAQGISSVSRAGIQRSAQINGNNVTPSQRTVSQVPQSPSQRAFIDATLERGPYPPEAGQASISAEEMRNAIQSGDLNKLQDVISKIYENRVFGSKFAIEGVTVRRNGDGGITWGGRLVNPETGQKVGDVARDITIDSQGRLNVYHRYLWIDAVANRGTGFSTEFKKLSDDFYKSVGVDYITISTVQDGSYAWGKANYTWKTERDAQVIRRYVQATRNNLPSFDTENAKILDDMLARFDKDFLDPDFPDPIDIANLQKADGTPWGREIMTDTGWNGIRYLNPDMDPRPQNRKDKGKKEEPVPAETKESKPVTTSNGGEQTGEEQAGSEQQGEEAVNADNAKYFGADGILKSEEWIDEAPDGSVLEQTTELGEVRLYRKKDGKWYNLTYNMVDGVPDPEDSVSSGYLKVVAGRLGRDGTTIRELSANPEEFKKYEDFANGVLAEANVDEMAVIEAINNKDNFAIANLFIQELFGNGERKFGDFYIKHAQVIPGTYSGSGEPKMTITASIVNNDGEEVGTVVRVLKQNRNGDIRVVHSLMKIYEDENKGTGFSTQFSAASEDLYERLNVAEIETLTAWDGSYVWARANYDWNFEDYSTTVALGGVPDSLDDALEQAIMDGRAKDANAISDIIERMSGLDSDDPNFPTPFEISSLVSEDPRITSLGRDILTDTKWQGLKRLGSAGRTGEEIAAEQETVATPETEETTNSSENNLAPSRVGNFTTGPSEEFEGWDGVDGIAFRQARLDEGRAAGMALIDAQNFSEEDRQKAIDHLNEILPTQVEDDGARYFAKGNHVVRIPNDELDSPYTYAVLGSLNEIIDSYPPGNTDTDYIINVVDKVNADMPSAGGRFIPGMGMIDYFMPTVESSWLEQRPGMKGWFSPAVDELLDENAPEDTIRQYIAHIVAHEYGHLLDNSFSDELRAKFRAELDKAGLTDIVGRYANSYADAETRGAGNIRNAEYFAESFAQMINEDFHGATNTPLGNLMRQFLKDNGVTK